MYEVWKIERGSASLIDLQRDPEDAKRTALEQSSLTQAVFYVVRRGFGVPLYFVLNGVISDPAEVLRKLSMTTTPAPAFEAVSTTEPIEDAPRPARRKRGPAEEKGKGGQPDTIKAYPTTVTAIDEEQGIVTAIVNVFGIVDDGDDVVHQGAFSKTLAENGMRVKVLDGHNNRSTLSVIGRPLNIREVGREELPPSVLMRYPMATGGLLTETQYLLNTPEGKGVFERIKAGAVNEYSIGFDAVDSDMERSAKGTIRHIRQVRLWEYSPVVFGMNPATVTVSVKSADAPEETKVGRVLSQRNFDAIKQAYDLLTTVMQSAGLTDEGEAEPAKTLDEQHEHATDGPSASTAAPTSDEAGPQDGEPPATKQARLLDELKQRLAEVEA